MTIRNLNQNKVLTTALTNNNMVIKTTAEFATTKGNNIGAVPLVEPKEQQPGTAERIIGGDGTKDNPYIIDPDPNHPGVGMADMAYLMRLAKEYGEKIYYRELNENGKPGKREYVE